MVTMSPPEIMCEMILKGVLDQKHATQHDGKKRGRKDTWPRCWGWKVQGQPGLPNELGKRVEERLLSG